MKLAATICVLSLSVSCASCLRLSSYSACQSKTIAAGRCCKLHGHFARVKRPRRGSNEQARAGQLERLRLHRSYVVLQSVSGVIHEFSLTYRCGGIRKYMVRFQDGHVEFVSACEQGCAPVIPNSTAWGGRAAPDAAASSIRRELLRQVPQAQSVQLVYRASFRELWLVEWVRLSRYTFAQTSAQWLASPDLSMIESRPANPDALQREVVYASQIRQGQEGRWLDFTRPAGDSGPSLLAGAVAGRPELRNDFEQAVLELAKQGRASELDELDQVGFQRRLANDTEALLPQGDQQFYFGFIAYPLGHWLTERGDVARFRLSMSQVVFEGAQVETDLRVASHQWHVRLEIERSRGRYLGVIEKTVGIWPYTLIVTDESGRRLRHTGAIFALLAVENGHAWASEIKLWLDTPNSSQATEYLSFPDETHTEIQILHPHIALGPDATPWGPY